MCGLAGEIRFDGRAADVAALGRMCDCMTRRGPDGSGVWQRGPIALGHRRLSIIDLSAAGSQPMVDSAIGLSVAFNGCSTTTATSAPSWRAPATGSSPRPTPR